ncbi:hypothetical protein HLH58_14305 [Providencia stuartii]|uniref:hypothetical protein n=1 Tax=Providencia TaxID=586 RepID=UPI00149526E7|nr:MULTISPECIES: hypothetical protein [Providencia]NPD96019.1 hypothetical protein [Providencia stuartii]HEM8301401.1 hypothetical protein [Providencia stuartii]
MGENYSINDAVYSTIKQLMPQCGTHQNGAKRQHHFVFAFLHDGLLGHGFLAG